MSLHRVWWDDVCGRWRMRASWRLLCGVAALLLPATLLASCSPLPSLGAPTATAKPLGNGVIGWPFDVTQGQWKIENGYNTTPDHFGYETYSFDFQRTDQPTAGQEVLSPVTGDSVNFGDAYPYNGTTGSCVSITISEAAYSGYHLMVCHLDHPVLGHVTRGERLGTINATANHLHITLYYLDPVKYPSDSKANAIHRKQTPFSDPWTIAGCNYPSDNSADQWANSTVPCSTSSPAASSTLPPPTPSPSPTPTADPLAACRSINGFGNAGPVDSLATNFVAGPAVPLPSLSIGYVERSFEDPSQDQPGMVYSFELIALCSPATSTSAVRSFFANALPAAGWTESSTYPYGGNYSDACGDPYCWAWGAYGGDINRFASLESVTQAGTAVTYELRLGVEEPPPQ